MLLCVCTWPLWSSFTMHFDLIQPLTTPGETVLFLLLLPHCPSPVSSTCSAPLTQMKPPWFSVGMFLSSSFLSCRILCSTQSRTQDLKGESAGHSPLGRYPLYWIVSCSIIGNWVINKTHQMSHWNGLLVVIDFLEVWLFRTVLLIMPVNCSDYKGVDF